MDVESNILKIILANFDNLIAKCGKSESGWLAMLNAGLVIWLGGFLGVDASGYALEYYEMPAKMKVGISCFLGV